MTIGVIGAGAMGTGIAQVAAQAGHDVILYDTRDIALEKAQKQLDKIYTRLVEKGRVTEEQKNVILNRIKSGDDIKNFRHCGLVIEAIIENLAIKQSVFESLEKVVHDECIIASNTSSLSIAALSSSFENPGRFLGIHFFNPAPLMPLVEIIPGISTSEEVIQESRQLIERWKKTVVLTTDTPGFIVNRVARPFYSEAIKMFEEGIADSATIDWALKEIGGFRMGPFELTDLIGHDVNYVVTETVWTQFYFDPRFKPSITQKRLLEAGLLGRKTGRGFYDYSEGAARPEPVRDEKLGQQIVDRIVAMLINEAADALLLRVASKEDIDLAMTKGVNYPKGLFRWADEIGLDKVLNLLRDLQDEYGDDRYRPCVLLKRMVKTGETFYA